MMVLLVGTFILIAIIRSIYVHIERKYDYWKKRNVRHLKPTLVVGNYGDYFLQKKTTGEVVQEMCRKRPREPYIAAYFGTQPVLIVQDPELIKTIVAKDFYYFNSRELMSYVHREHLNYNLFFTHGDKWKVLRQNFTPLFSPPRMRNMFHLIEKCAYSFETALDEQIERNDIINSEKTLARYNIDVIGSCVFGIDNKLTEDTEINAFMKIVEKTFESSFIKGLLFCFRSAWPSVFYGLGLRMIPKVVSDFLNNLLARAFEARQYKQSNRNDFVDLMLNYKQKNYMTADNFIHRATTEKLVLKVDDHLLSSQSTVFFTAGYETALAAMTFTLYEFAKNEEIQDRAFLEIEDYLFRHNNQLDYECVNEMPYLEACLNEAMRLYPALGVITREVVEDYTLPTGMRLEKGLLIHLPVYYLHHNPEYFPAPEEFRPERFLCERITIRPYTYMAFGEGPRICIGMRFSRMQTMCGLITIMKKYRVKLAAGMSRKLQLDPRTYVTHAKEDVRLKLVLRDDWQKREYNRY